MTNETSELVNGFIVKIKTESTSCFEIPLSAQVTPKSVHESMAVAVEKSTVDSRNLNTTKTRPIWYSNQLITFQSDCLGIVSSLNVTIATSPIHSILQYDIYLPQNISLLTAPPDADVWQTAIGVSIYPSHGSPFDHCVEVIFQAAPDWLNITYYLLNLHDKNKTMYKFLDITVTPSEVLGHTFLIRTDGDFIITVDPHGPSCVNNTCSRTEAAFYIQKPGYTSTPSSRKSTTITTGTQTPTLTEHKTLTSTQVTDSSVHVKPSDQKQVYETNVKIIAGTVCGVLLLAILGILIACCVYHRRRRNRNRDFAMERMDSSSMLNGGIKQRMVLIIYSYDCQVHEKVVVEFATFLKHVVGCEVALDIWEQSKIIADGAPCWLENRLQCCQFVIVVCSIGARFKCIRQQELRVKEDRRPVPESFTLAVDMVTNKMQLAFNAKQSLDRFIVVYFDYAVESDIPPKLDRAHRFSLMKDAAKLYCHIHDIQPCPGSLGNQPALPEGLTKATYNKTQTGKQLYQALENARQFFSENPDWLGTMLEPVTPPSPTKQPYDGLKEGVAEQNKKDDISNCPLENDGKAPDEDVRSYPCENETSSGSLGSSSTFSTSEEDALLERRKRRETEADRLIPTIPRHSSAKCTPRRKLRRRAPRKRKSRSCPSIGLYMDKPKCSNPNESNEHASINGYSNPLYGDVTEPPEIGCVDDDEQLKLDVEFIQNFDAYHRSLAGVHNPTESCIQPISALCTTKLSGVDNNLNLISPPVGLKPFQPGCCFPVTQTYASRKTEGVTASQSNHNDPLKTNGHIDQYIIDLESPML